MTYSLLKVGKTNLIFTEKQVLAYSLSIHST